MRLPELAEWKYACKNGTSLTNMTVYYEWASNGAIPIDNAGGSYQGIAASTIGNGSCYDAGWGWVARVVPSATEDSLPNRCIK